MAVILRNHVFHFGSLRSTPFGSLAFCSIRSMICSSAFPLQTYQIHGSLVNVHCFNSIRQLCACVCWCVSARLVVNRTELLSLCCRCWRVGFFGLHRVCGPFFAAGGPQRAGSTDGGSPSQSKRCFTVTTVLLSSILRSETMVFFVIQNKSGWMITDGGDGKDDSLVTLTMDAMGNWHGLHPFHQTRVAQQRLNRILPEQNELNFS